MKTSSETKTDGRNGKSDLKLTKGKGLINFGEQKFSGPGQLPRTVDEIPSSFVNSSMLFPFLPSVLILDQVFIVNHMFQNETTIVV